MGTGGGKCIVELDDDGHVTWSLQAKDIPELGINYIAGMHVQPNGNIAVSAYKSRFTLFEITRDKKIVWKIAGKKGLIASHIQVLTDASDPEKFKMCK